MLCRSLIICFLMLVAFSNPVIAVDSDSAVFEFYAHKKNDGKDKTYSITYENLYDPADPVIVDGKEFVVSFDDLKTDNYVQLYEVIYETNHLQKDSTEIVFTLYPFNAVNNNGEYIDRFYKTCFYFSHKVEFSNEKDETQIEVQVSNSYPVVNSSYNDKKAGQDNTVLIKGQGNNRDLNGTLSVKIIVSAKIIIGENQADSSLYKMPVKITVSGG